MRSYFKIKLCEGRRVRHVDSGEILKADQVYKVEAKQFWFRRLEQGDVQLVKEAMDKPKKKVQDSQAENIPSSRKKRGGKFK